MRACQTTLALMLLIGPCAVAANGQITYPGWWDTASHQTIGNFEHDNVSDPDEVFSLFLENTPIPGSGPIEIAVELHYIWDGSPVPGPDTFDWLEFLAPVSNSQPVGTDPMNVFTPDTSQEAGEAGDMTRFFTCTHSEALSWEGVRFQFTGDLFPGAGHVWITCDLRAKVPVAGDFDGDGNVDIDDFAQFPGCMTGPNNGPVAGGCRAFDFEPDDDVDLADFAGFQQAFTGP